MAICRSNYNGAVMGSLGLGLFSCVNNCIDLLSTCDENSYRVSYEPTNCPIIRSVSRQCRDKLQLEI